jgi:hypothetical protein
MNTQANLLQDLKISLTFNVSVPANVWNEEDGNEFVFSNSDIEFDDAELTCINAESAIIAVNAVCYGYSTIDAVHGNYAENGVDIETDLLVDGIQAVINDVIMTDVIGLGI